MNHGTKNQAVRTAHKRVGLYAFVFAGKISVMAVLLLFVSFLIQPFHQALANESLPAAPSEAAPAVPEEVKLEESPPDSAIIEEEPSETVPINNSPDPSVEVNNHSPGYDDSGGAVADTSENNPGEVVTTKSSSTKLAAAAITTERSSTTPPSDTGPPDSTIETNINTSTSSTGTGGVVVDGGSVTPGASTGLETSPGGSGEVVDDDTEVPFSNNVVTDNSPPDDVVNTNVATTAEPVVIQAQSLVTDDNFYQFSKQSCVAIGDGTYHCTLKTGPQSDPDAAVYSEQDTDGDMEIYMRTSKGDIEKLSDNAYDDTSPHYDAESMRVVWQRMVDDRYQIIAYDLIEKKETQLTFSRTNNMEPKVSVEGIVWQAWDGHDWEVMFFDGKYTDQITDNEIQDVTPVGKDGYIMWSILGGNKQEARVYSIQSKETMTISGNEGGSIVNPRFVLVYDTKFENGDIVTQGFDPATGLSSIIAAIPASAPVDIPDVDTTGEIRALIQNKSTQKEDTGPDGVKTPTGAGGLDLGHASTSAASSGDTLNLKQPVSDMIPVVATTTQPQFELTDYDLVITRTATSTGGIASQASTTIPVTNASSTKQ